ncbi:MAG TPA: amino acid--[acyl-carrier-protein] ligase, partial [Acidimicrobiales bacterium]|nr:amino acid--[acyl-carrier-protein] ligase [Acidimicrobiales bacterium]
GSDPYSGFRSQLFDAGVLVSTGVDGLYGRSAAYERILAGIDALVTSEILDAPADAIFFPPVMARWVFDRTDYLKSFPDLMGSVHTFRGSDRDHAELVRLVDEGEDWPKALVPADVVLCSATCHPLYPLCTGRLPKGGRRFEVNGYCFRCEPSVDPARMQAFHMHEYVYVGEADEAQSHRDRGLERGLELLASLGLDVSKEVANDPFFGRVGKMLAASQIDEALKIEVVTPICSEERPTAIMSANCHRDHFGLPFAIETDDGETAHSACVAFGVDRVTLALLARHGLDLERWPTSVRDRLWP